MIYNVLITSENSDPMENWHPAFQHFQYYVTCRCSKQSFDKNEENSLCFYIYIFLITSQNLKFGEMCFVQFMKGNYSDFQ